LVLYLMGERHNNLGGSVIADVLGLRSAGPLPPIDYAETSATITAVIHEIRSGLIVAAHDISDGGLLACVVEMCLGGDGKGSIGASLAPVAQWAPQIAPSAALFGETGGFVVAVRPEHADTFERAVAARGATPKRLGVTGGALLRVEGACEILLDDLRHTWMSPLQELFA
jgi:phosphoribosylformylglycinamidine synthase subunit PurL